jgi:hypothetical protein
VNFSGIAFQNSRLHFVETSVTVNHCVFANTEKLVMNFTVLHQNLTTLSFQNVHFETNEACISVTSNSANTGDMLFISIHIKNSVFNNNGLRRIPILSSPSWTILGVDTSGTHFVDIQMKNTSFRGSYVRSSGMIFVKNQLGHTEFSIQDVVFVENGLHDTGARNSLFVLSSSIVSIFISQSQVKKNKQRLISIYSTWAEINVSHTTVDDFINPQPHGGMFYIESDMMKLFIIDCLFSNGKSNPGHGGLLFVYAHNTSILIENSILTNLTTSGYGGVVYATAYLVQMFIQNSLFERNTASTGGCIDVESVSGKHVQLVLTGKNVTFTRNSAGGPGGVMKFKASVIRVSFSNVLFKGNYATVGPGGVISVTGIRSSNDSTLLFNLTASHVQ